MQDDIRIRIRGRMMAIGLLMIALLLIACTLPDLSQKKEITIPYLMRGTWMNEEGTATITATEHNLILSYGYVPGANMNLEQLLNDMEGMYKIESTNTMIKVFSDSMGITLYEFVVIDDMMTCTMSGSERIILYRQ